MGKICEYLGWGGERGRQEGNNEDLGKREATDRGKSSEPAGVDLSVSCRVNLEREDPGGRPT